jgi:hypothetical protein
LQARTAPLLIALRFIFNLLNLMGQNTQHTINFVLNGIMLNVIMLIVVMLNGGMLIVMLSLVAQHYSA